MKCIDTPGYFLVMFGFLLCICDIKTDCTINCDQENGTIEWSYGEGNGPACWSECFPLCSGSEQSPIDLEVGVPLSNDSNSDLTLINYYQTREANFTNNGHTLRVDLERDVYGFTGIGLDGVYVADQLHFHWGGDNDAGSEHTFDGQSYPMEMHVVHHANGASLADNLGKSGGVAVLAFLFEISDDDNKDLDVLFDNIDKVVFKDQSVVIDSFAPGNLLPKVSKLDYYQYDGSLTSPPCIESVTWNIVSPDGNRIGVSERQLKRLRTLVHEGGDVDSPVLMYNYRPVQPRNRRTISYRTASLLTF